MYHIALYLQIRIFTYVKIRVQCVISLNRDKVFSDHHTHLLHFILSFDVREVRQTHLPLSLNGGTCAAAAAPCSPALSSWAQDPLPQNHLSTYSIQYSEPIKITQQSLVDNINYGEQLFYLKTKVFSNVVMFA